jgi:hypothetical protein
MNKSNISEEAVKKATGKNLKEWFSILDKEGAKKLNHTEIARLVYKKYLPTNGWWSQMVTVEYERARGLRKINETSQGFVVAVHKTVPSTIKALQNGWEEILKSKEVAKKKLEKIPSKTKRAMLRYKADVGGVVVYFDERGKDKSRIKVETIRLASSSSVETARRFWKKVLEDHYGD